MLGIAGERLPVFQWHSYSFELPRDATHLASTATCEQQAFRYGNSAYGFQFHLEADVPVIERWLGLPSFRAELAAAGLPTDEQAIRAETERLVAATRRSADAVFNSFLDLVGRPNRRRPLPSRGMPSWTEATASPRKTAGHNATDSHVASRRLFSPRGERLEREPHGRAVGTRVAEHRAVVTGAVAGRRGQQLLEVFFVEQVASPQEARPTAVVRAEADRRFSSE